MFINDMLRLIFGLLDYRQVRLFARVSKQWHHISLLCRNIGLYPTTILPILHDASIKELFTDTSKNILNTHMKNNKLFINSLSNKINGDSDSMTDNDVEILITPFTKTHIELFYIHILHNTNRVHGRCIENHAIGKYSHISSKCSLFDKLFSCLLYIEKIYKEVYMLSNCKNFGDGEYYILWDSSILPDGYF